MPENMIAACGLDCSVCPIGRASPGDLDAARSLVGWWRGEGWLKEWQGVEEVLRRCPLCLGCRADRAAHWSPDCWILRCCVDDRGLDHCSECEIFPCDRLSAWGETGRQYGEALGRLHQMAPDSF